MTGQQLSIGDCEPTWDDWEQLCARGAEELEDPVDRRWHDLRGQGLTARQFHRITDVKITGSYL